MIYGGGSSMVERTTVTRVVAGSSPARHPTSMKFKVHFTLGNFGQYEDFVIVEADTLEECQEKAAYEVTRRNGSDPWSEEIQ